MNKDLFDFYVKKHDLAVLWSKDKIKTIYYTRKGVKYEMKEVKKDEWEASGENFCFAFAVKDREKVNK